MGGKNAKEHNKTGCGYGYWPMVWAPITTYITTYTITCSPIYPCNTTFPTFFNGYNAAPFQYNQFNPFSNQVSFQKLNAFAYGCPQTQMNKITSGKLMLKAQNGAQFKYKW